MDTDTMDKKYKLLSNLLALKIYGAAVKSGPTAWETAEPVALNIRVPVEFLEVVNAIENAFGKCVPKVNYDNGVRLIEAVVNDFIFEGVKSHVDEVSRHAENGTLEEGVELLLKIVSNEKQD